MNTIVNKLDKDIRGGVYPPNARLPSERALASQYNVPLSVARKVLSQLCDSGLIYRVERGGTFVNLENRLREVNATDTPVKCINFIEPTRGREDPFGFALADYLNGYTACLQHHPLRVRFVTFDTDHEDFATLLNPTLHASVQSCVIGDILSPDMMRWLDDRAVPFVVRRHSVYDSASLPAHHGVFLNRHAALCEAVRHLMGLRHVRIGFVGQVLDGAKSELALDRVPCLEGYRAAFHLAGRVPPQGFEAYPSGGFGLDIRRAAESLLRMQNRPTAIACQNDFTALNVMRTARQLGLRIPADLSVTGFDNDPACALSDPPLSTFGGHEALARAAIERLFSAMEADPPDREVLPVPCEWIPRKSTAPPSETCKPPRDSI